MPELSLPVLVIALLVLIAISAFFSGSETAMMALNRYRLRHLAAQQHPGAKRAQKLLDRPDRLIGLILLCNNFVNIAATTIATLVSIELLGEIGPLVATLILTVVILIFAETTPKTLAALHPERVAYPASALLRIFLLFLYPFVWAINITANAVLRLFSVRLDQQNNINLSRDELRTVVKEAGALIPGKYQEMLSRILDLEHVTVEDIMVPRSEIDGIDLTHDPNELRDQLMTAHHTRILCYRGSFDDLVGVLHMRKVLRLLTSGEEISMQSLQDLADEAYFIPDGTDLNTQLINFQRRKQRFAVVVDEYGQVAGLLTLDDLLEEVVGEFTTDTQDYDRDIFPQDDGTYLIDGSATLREINRSCGWRLPEDGPKTLNGLILESLEDIPDADTSLRINHYTIEVENVTGQSVKTARIRPPPAAEMDVDTSP